MKSTLENNSQPCVVDANILLYQYQMKNGEKYRDGCHSEGPIRNYKVW